LQLLKLWLKLMQIYLSRMKKLRNPNVKRKSASQRKIRRLVVSFTRPRLRKVKRLRLLEVLLRHQLQLLRLSRLMLRLFLNNQLPFQ
jgi:hypothetical protein